MQNRTQNNCHIFGKHLYSIFFFILYLAKNQFYLVLRETIRKNKWNLWYSIYRFHHIIYCKMVVKQLSIEQIMWDFACKDLFCIHFDFFWKSHSSIDTKTAWRPEKFWKKCELSALSRHCDHLLSQISIWNL